MTTNNSEILTARAERERLESMGVPAHGPAMERLIRAGAADRHAARVGKVRELSLAHTVGGEENAKAAEAALGVKVDALGGAGIITQALGVCIADAAGVGGGWRRDGASTTRHPAFAGIPTKQSGPGAAWCAAVLQAARGLAAAAMAATEAAKEVGFDGTGYAEPVLGVQPYDGRLQLQVSVQARGSLDTLALRLSARGWEEGLDAPEPAGHFERARARAKDIVDEIGWEPILAPAPWRASLLAAMLDALASGRHEIRVGRGAADQQLVVGIADETLLGDVAAAFDAAVDQESAPPPQAVVGPIPEGWGSVIA